jgi:hypothetical protein
MSELSGSLKVDNENFLPRGGCIPEKESTELSVFI